MIDRDSILKRISMLEEELKELEESEKPGQPGLEEKKEALMQRISDLTYLMTT